MTRLTPVSHRSLRRAATLALSLGLLFLSACSGEPPEKVHHKDLVALQAALTADHPTASGAKDARLEAWLAEGFSAAETRGAKVADRTGHFYSLLAYTAGFRDAHVSVTPAFALPTVRWPGFLLVRRGKEFVVATHDGDDPALPPAGAVLDVCDGDDAATLIAKRLLPYGFDQRVPANRFRVAAELVLDRGNPFAPPLKSCIFSDGGAMRAVALSYRAVPKDFDKRYEAALFGPTAPLGWREPATGIVWIGLPSFDYEEPNASRLRKVMDRLAADAARIREGRAIVFDVRGNTGGSSLWADEIRNILWYPDQIAKWGPPDPSGVDWRASVGNRDYMLNMINEVVPKVGSQSDVGLALTRIARGLSEAVAAKKLYWREGNAKPGTGGGLTERRPTAATALFPAKVIILSNGSCASACLDFADRILQMPGTHIVGFATAGDGLTTESRAVTLPSGLAVLHFPMKIYRGRPRGDMEVYAPDIAYDGPWTDKAVQAWVVGLIEQGKL